MNKPSKSQILYDSQVDLIKAYAEISVLQRALLFWLPTMPSKLNSQALYERLDADIALLAGYDGPMEQTAEELGWIVLVDADTSSEGTK